MTGLFDCHFHIIDYRFPLVPNSGYLPEEFRVADYLGVVQGMGVVGGALVSGSFQAFDQAYLVAALRELGPGYVGVTQLPASVSDAEVLRLAQAGVRAVRFNLKRGGSAGVEDIGILARRVHELAGWHAEFYVDSADLPELSPTLRALPSLCIDHLGLSAEGFATLLDLAGRGARVKATGFGRASLDVPHALKSIMAANPDSLMFGTDLPSTRAPRPFDRCDLAMIREIFDEAAAQRVLYSNAASFYRIGRSDLESPA